MRTSRVYTEPRFLVSTKDSVCNLTADSVIGIPAVGLDHERVTGNHTIAIYETKLQIECRRPIAERLPLGVSCHFDSSSTSSP